jgi:hypothetical protein
MKTSPLLELVVGIIAIVLLVLLLNPFMLWMPTPLQYGVVALALIACGVFGGVVLREHADDERELLHTMLSGRIAYLSGFTVLVIGAVYQALTAMVDTWLFSAIAVMVVVKLAVRWWLERRG